MSDSILTARICAWKTTNKTELTHACMPKGSRIVGMEQVVIPERIPAGWYLTSRVYAIAKTGAEHCRRQFACVPEFGEVPKGSAYVGTVYVPPNDILCHVFDLGECDSD